MTGQVQLAGQQETRKTFWRNVLVKNNTNYFETSHEKGEQDAAHSHIIKKISQVVLNRTDTINSAKAMHEYLEANFT